MIFILEKLMYRARYHKGPYRASSPPLPPPILFVLHTNDLAEVIKSFYLHYMPIIQQFIE